MINFTCVDNYTDLHDGVILPYIAELDTEANPAVLFISHIIVPKVK